MIFDSGAVFALARGDDRALAFLAEAGRRRRRVLVPVAVVAETSRGSGPRDARVNWVLRTIGEVPAAIEATGRTAGRLLADAESSATIDALVVAEAVLCGGARILTSDPDDLRALADGHPEVQIHAL